MNLDDFASIRSDEQLAEKLPYARPVAHIFQNNLPSITYILLYGNRMLVSDGPLLWPNIADRVMCQISLPIALVVVHFMYSACRKTKLGSLAAFQMFLSHLLHLHVVPFCVLFFSFHAPAGIVHLFLSSPLILCLYCSLLPPFDFVFRTIAPMAACLSYSQYIIVFSILPVSHHDTFISASRLTSITPRNHLFLRAFPPCLTISL